MVATDGDAVVRIAGLLGEGRGSFGYRFHHLAPIVPSVLGGVVHFGTSFFQDGQRFVIQEAQAGVFQDLHGGVVDLFNLLR